MLPGLSGLDVFGALRAQLPVPISYVSETTPTAVCHGPAARGEHMDAGQTDAGLTDWRRVAPEHLAASARRHLWMHFTRHGAFESGAPLPIIVRGEGEYIWDSAGRRYLDGLSGLFVVQAGHGRSELAQAAAAQGATLGFFPVWGYAHPEAIQLAERLASLAPGDLNRVFFTSGGGESVETVWKLAKQYLKLTGKPAKHKVISRATAYHGTPQGALAITGVAGAKTPFEPLVPGAHKAANTDFYRAPVHAEDAQAFGRWAADQIEAAILMEDPATVAAVFVSWVLPWRAA